MEAWSLPAEAAVRLERLEYDLGAERIAGPDGALVRGGHWRNFQVKYEESNRLHKKMLALSALCRLRGDPPDARRAVGRGQCNDAYWHGVFGGLYLPHLRQGVWRELARAEGILRAGETLEYEILDLDYDGNEEIWVHSSSFSAIVSPARGGAIEELTLFDSGTNYADTLTRRREAYHQLRPQNTAALTEASVEVAADHAASIHDIEQGLRMDELPPVDLDPRALFVDRVLPAGLATADYERAEYRPLASWARTSLAFRVKRLQNDIVVELIAEDDEMSKRIQFNERGSVRVSYRWATGAFPSGAHFAPEISLAAPASLRVEGGAEPWRFPIETVAKSERGLERTVQGESLTPRWPVEDGEGIVTLEPEILAEAVRA
jgi:alpha-amylase